MHAVSHAAALVAILDGAEGGRRIRIPERLTVGRGADAGLFIDDPEISRAHAVFRPTEDGLEIQDLGSLNGTWVNAERIISPTPLAPGDVIKVGTTRIEVLSAGGGRVASARRPSPTPVEAEDELRPVSVLFADVVGSTPLAERLEPEDFAALIGGCVDRMCRAVEQFGGVIDAYMGDGIAAFFGFPAATEDDAERAARAALSVVKAIDTYAEEVRETWKHPGLNVRVGVNSGQVAVGVVGVSQRHPVALGDTMNVAARLQGTAEPGTIVIGGATAKKLRGRFLVRPLGHLAVRGRARPVEAWRLLGARTDQPRSDPSGLVGRVQETAQLVTAADALRSGQGRLVIVDGEAGIGKTRLLEWLQDHLRDEVTWLEGHCTSYGGQPTYHAPAEALRGWVAVDDVVQRSSTLERLGLEADALPYLVMLLSPDGGADGGADDFGLALEQAYSAWVKGLCRDRPVVLAIHDIHWADQSTLDLLERLVNLLDDHPLMIATTSRVAADAHDRRFRESARRKRADRVVELRLGPLAEAEADELLSRLAPGEVEREARNEVLAQAEGNPLYVEQLLRSLLESGGLAARRTWALTVPAAQLPTGLESLLVARIAALPRDARRVAQVGAVLGRTFGPSVLSLVPGVEDVERNLTRLLRADIIREVRALPNREYAFTHGLLQEAALSTLTRARRRELYGGVATAYEQVFSDSLDDQLERLAFYWARAGNFERALEYLERAANRATSLHAQTQAADLWTRAAAVAAKVNDPEARVRIERRLVELSA
jgi:class 3 adenylate cyclase/tetratricopeptide (TPR) repeat protein